VANARDGTNCSSAPFGGGVGLCSHGASAFPPPATVRNDVLPKCRARRVALLPRLFYGAARFLEVCHWRHRESEQNHCFGVQPRRDGESFTQIAS
jgi:hypothetical protein